MATVTIIGSGMMGSALAFPARANGHRVCLVGTPLDREIIKACKDVNEAISKIIDPFVIERCAELSPDGDLHFFTGSWNSRVNLNDFIDKLISLDPYRNGSQATGDLHNYTHAHGSRRFTRCHEMRLKKKRGNDK